MLSFRPRSAPTVFALLLAAAALGLAGCAGDDGRADAVKALSEPGGKGQSMLKVGDASRMAGDCQAAIRFYRLVKDNDEHHLEAAAARAGAADCELSLNALPDAERDYRTAMGLVPQDPAPLIGLGRIALVEHKPGEAATYLDRAIKKGADAAFVWNDKGVAYDQLRRHKEAQQAYREGLGKFPADRALRNNLALSLAMTGEFNEAENLLRALAADPGATARTRENLALVLGLEGNGAEARRVAQNDLDGAALDNNIRFYQYARALITGTSLPSSTAAVDTDTGDAAPKQMARAEAAPVPPPVLVKDRPLLGLRTAEPTRLEENRPEIAQTVLPAPAPSKAATVQPAPTQTAALPETTAKPAVAAAEPTGRVVILPPTRIVAADGGALKSEATAKTAAPVASSENQ
jgi:Flp pilus assembly protein TadD